MHIEHYIGNKLLTGTSLPLVAGRAKAGPYNVCGRV